jgi:HSP20 family molecular chaperone IbpA
MMNQSRQDVLRGMDHVGAEMAGLLGEPVGGQRWSSTRQQKAWRPPTDVYETDDCVVVKVEIAGMAEEDFAVSLDGRRLVISGVRRDPAAKLGYQQMEILYGHFETDVHLSRAIEEDKIEATYRNGFLGVRLPKAKPRQVPVLGVEDPV